MIEKLVEALKTDADYRRTWVANIVMAIDIELKGYASLDRLDKGAEHFIDNLIMDFDNSKLIGREKNLKELQSILKDRINRLKGVPSGQNYYKHGLEEALRLLEELLPKENSEDWIDCPERRTFVPKKELLGAKKNSKLPTHEEEDSYEKELDALDGKKTKVFKFWVTPVIHRTTGEEILWYNQGKPNYDSGAWNDCLGKFKILGPAELIEITREVE